MFAQCGIWGNKQYNQVDTVANQDESALHLCIFFLLLGGTTIGWPFALKSDKQVVPLGGGLCSNFGARWERGV